MESSLAAEEEDDYALIEHQLQKQRKLEAQKANKLTEADFVAQVLKNRDQNHQAKDGMSSLSEQPLQSGK